MPVDGVVLEGRSAVDEALLSGEPLPVEKEPGTTVIGGTLNGTGGMLVRATRIGADTVLGQIVRLVGEAQRSRAPIQRLVDRVARWFVPAVLGIAVLTFTYWFGVDPTSYGMSRALLRAVAVLVIACPCALGLATPMAIMVGVGRGAEDGIFVRDVAALEVLTRASVLLLDKTGTLTEGKPKLVVIEPSGEWTGDELLRLTASLERGSEHPLAAAFVRRADQESIKLTPATDFQSATGFGVRGNVSGRAVVVGNERLLTERGIEVSSITARADELRQKGHTVLLAAIDGRLAGLLAVVDPIRATTPAAIKELQADGLKLVMLTGDNAVTATAVARQLGLQDFRAGMLPADKSDEVARWQSTGTIVAMAGDGSNDAPALAGADVGIALASGTDVALASAGITLMHGDLRMIVRARRLSRLTLNAIRQNLFLAFFYNTVSIPLAAFGWLSPVVAGAAMSLSSISVILNSLRLRWR